MASQQVQGRIFKLISESQTPIWLKLRCLSSGFDSRSTQQHLPPPEPIPNRPLRAPRNPKFDTQFHNNTNFSVHNKSHQSEDNLDFLEKFKLGADKRPQPQQPEQQVEGNSG